jgi:hypothetical protein
VDVLVDMIWLSAGAAGRLLVLDQEGTVWAHTSGGGLQWLALPGADSGSVENWRLSSYKDRLYALAPQRGQVLRYHPIGNSFGDPESYFRSDREVDISGVSDMAIDGHIYLLWERGFVRRFLGGMEQQLHIELPDTPLGRTPALFARPDEETAHLYIADAAQQRVIQLTKEGEFVRQFKAQDPGLFTGLRGLFVDEAQGRLLITDGHRLLLAEVPAHTSPQR